MTDNSRPPAPSVVGKQFIRRYYDLLSKDPSNMYHFYSENSALVCGEGSQNQEPVVGLAAIRQKLEASGYQDAIIDLQNGSIDAQLSKDGGVLLLVTGTITKKGQGQRLFVQSFFLAPQAANNGGGAASGKQPAYFVLNDTFRVVEPPAPTKSATAANGSAAAARLPARPAVQPARSTPAAAPEKAAAAPAAPAPEKTEAAAPAPAAPTKAAPPAAKPAVPPAAPAPKPSSWAGVVKLGGGPSAASAPSKAAVHATPPAPAPAPAATPPAAAERPAAAASTPVPAPASAPAAASPSTTPDPVEQNSTSRAAGDGAAQEDEGGEGPKRGKHVTPGDVPSTAIFVKNLETTMTEDELKAIFQPFLNPNGQMLVAAHFAKGHAFVDLGSTEAVARSVTASRSEGIKVSDKRLVVEPSKKPVRPSGLRAMHERKGPAAGQGGGKPQGGGGRAGRGGPRGERRAKGDRPPAAASGGGASGTASGTADKRA